MRLSAQNHRPTTCNLVVLASHLTFTRNDSLNL
jgi:hypothetical protein